MNNDEIHQVINNLRLIAQQARDSYDEQAEASLFCDAQRLVKMIEDEGELRQNGYIGEKVGDINAWIDGLCSNDRCGHSKREVYEFLGLALNAVESESGFDI